MVDKGRYCSHGLKEKKKRTPEGDRVYAHQFPKLYIYMRIEGFQFLKEQNSSVVLLFSTICNVEMGGRGTLKHGHRAIGVDPHSTFLPDWRGP